MNINILNVKNQFIIFVLLNGFAAIINFLSRILFSHFVNYPTAIVLAYIVGMCTAYLLCKMFVFESIQNKVTKQILYFVLINAFALLQTLLISILFAKYILHFLHHTSLQEAIGHFIGLCAPVISSYFGHKYITFK